MSGILIFFGVMAIMSILRFVSPGLYMIFNLALPLVLIFFAFRRFSRMQDMFRNPGGQSGQFGQNQSPFANRSKTETSNKNTKKREEVNKANPNKEEIIAEVLEVKDLDAND